MRLAAPNIEDLHLGIIGHSLSIKRPRHQPLT
jgi:hypothetical protein